MCLYFTQTQKLCSCYYYLHAQFHSLDHRLVDYLLSQILEKKNTFNPYIHELHNWEEVGLWFCCCYNNNKGVIGRREWKLNDLQQQMSPGFHCLKLLLILLDILRFKKNLHSLSFWYSICLEYSLNL